MYVLSRSKTQRGRLIGGGGARTYGKRRVGCGKRSGVESTDGGARLPHPRGKGNVESGSKMLSSLEHPRGYLLVTRF